MIGKLNQAEIDDVLKHQRVGRIGCHNNKQVYVVPISYAYDGDCVYSHTFEGQKIDMMRSNPDVCFQVDNLKNLSNWQSVITWGHYEEVNDPEERKQALQILSAQAVPVISGITKNLSDNWPFSSRDLCEIKGIIFRIRLKERTGRFERLEDSPSFIV